MQNDFNVPPSGPFLMTMIGPQLIIFPPEKDKACGVSFRFGTFPCRVANSHEAASATPGTHLCVNFPCAFFCPFFYPFFCPFFYPFFLSIFLAHFPCPFFLPIFLAHFPGPFSWPISPPQAAHQCMCSLPHARRHFVGPPLHTLCSGRTE
ncbi:hypothetical protein PVBG_01893 [Plasmodium vivax Brazil I]|uniref:Uncharacterized protein n=1 Tax=Plasmodium vivax (strain Brazil I) TaxID=1033975 RepID=A0A0J9SW46_PLAV1|nr:hypothetical protein PVBG_01893 [Plasmodium vivax Brazil I]